MMDFHFVEQTTSNPRFKVEGPLRRPGIPFDDLVAGFLRVFEGGFEAESFHRQERRSKQEAAELLQVTLSPESMEDLLHNRNYAEIADRSRKVAQATNLIFRIEKAQFHDALKVSANQELFAVGLHSLLYSAEPEPKRFASFVNMLGSMGASKWTTA